MPGRRRVRRPVHRQHDGDHARLPRRQRLRIERDPGHASGETGGGRARRRAGDEARRGRPASFAGADARGLRERDRGGRGHRWLDERRLASARDRRRGWSRAVDRRLRPHLGAHADRRRHQARRALRRDRPLSRGRRRPGCARARARRRRQRRRGRRRRPVAARGRRRGSRASRPGRRRLMGPPVEADGRASRSCAGTSRPTVAS